MKNFKKILSVLAILGMATIYTSVSAANWYAPRCNGGTLKNKLGTSQFHCKTTTSRTPSCPSGKTKKVKSVGKDKCESVSSGSTKNAVCNVGVGNNKNNWRKNVKRGADNCTHKTKNKGVKPLKCSGAGYALSVDRSGNTDKCVKGSTSVVSTTISCNSNETHKTGGTDKCERTTETRPIF